MNVNHVDRRDKYALSDRADSLLKMKLATTLPTANSSPRVKIPRTTMYQPRPLRLVTDHFLARVGDILAPSKKLNELSQRIIVFIHDAFLQRNNSIVRDRDVLGTNFSAALRDVAIADAEQFL
jgi:hypothetical protein